MRCDKNLCYTILSVKCWEESKNSSVFPWKAGLEKAITYGIRCFRSESPISFQKDKPRWCHLDSNCAQNGVSSFDELRRVPFEPLLADKTAEVICFPVMSDLEFRLLVVQNYSANGIFRHTLFCPHYRMTVPPFINNGRIGKETESTQNANMHAPRFCESSLCQKMKSLTHESVINIATMD